MTRVIQGLRLQTRQNAQRLGIPLETTAPCGDLIQRPLPVMPVRRMTDVMGQPRQLRQILIRAQLRRDPPRNLRHLQRMRQTSTRRITLMRPHDLSLIRQPSQSSRMQHTRTIPGKRRTMRLHHLRPRQQRLLRPLTQDAVEIGR